MLRSEGRCEKIRRSAHQLHVRHPLIEGKVQTGSIILNFVVAAIDQCPTGMAGMTEVARWRPNMPGDTGMIQATLFLPSGGFWASMPKGV